MKAETQLVLFLAILSQCQEELKFYLPTTELKDVLDFEDNSSTIERVITESDLQEQKAAENNANLALLRYGIQAVVYQDSLDFQISYPATWGIETDGNFVKFFPTNSLNTKIVQLYFIVTHSYDGENLSKSWFLSRFPATPLFVDGAIKILEDGKYESAQDLAFYYLYFFAYDAIPVVSYYLGAGNVLYEISFRGGIEALDLAKNEELLELTQNIVDTFSLKEKEFEQANQPLKIAEVPHYSQTNAPWSGNKLGACGTTIAQEGCALVSKAMVFNYYLSDFSDPGKLNDCLTAKGGYFSGCNMSWGNVCAPNSVSAGSAIASLSGIASELASGYPVIVETTCKYPMHFVVAVEKSGNTYKIIDPLGGAETTLASQGYCFVAGRTYHGKTFACSWQKQSPTSAKAYVLKPGQFAEFSVTFKNTGTLIWVRDDQKGVANPNHLELWSANKYGEPAGGLLYDTSWIDEIRVTTLASNIKEVKPGKSATFTFNVKTPANLPADKLNKDLQIYFIPTLGGKTKPEMCFGGTHFLVRIEAPPPECNEGEGEVKGCEKCGMKFRNCINGKWTAWTDCLDQKECEKEATKSESCGQCMQQTWWCNFECIWEKTGECVGKIDCQPGTPQSQSCGTDKGECQNGIKTIICNNNCAWPSWDSAGCVGAIGAVPEICDTKDNDCDGETDEDCFKPVYRFYYSSGQDKDHFLKNDDSVPSSYSIENNGKPVFHAFKENTDKTKPLYRLYSDALKDHMYTDSKEEKESAMAGGYKDEGNIGYCATEQISGTIPLYRCWSSKYSDHLSTDKKEECDAEGYGYEQITCYVWP